MPRRAKGARLYIRRRKGRAPQFVILDGTREIGTGCGPDDVDGANRALARYLAEIFRPDTGQCDLAQVFCGEVMALYARDLPEDSPSRATIGYHIRALAPFWGARSLADVKGSTCRAYVAQRPVKPSTARQELKTFQAAINHWHRESPLAAVPRVTLPPAGQRRERVLERREVAALLRAARRLKLGHVARFILVGIYTGTRHGAILKLGWHASLGGGHAALGNGILFRRGSAERETSKRRPPVRLPRRIHSHLERWQRHDARHGFSARIIHYHGRPILRMKRAWHAVVTAAGLGPDVTPHTLRHTCASWLLWQGHTIWDVAGILGADASTIERVYGHHRKLDDAGKRRA